MRFCTAESDLLDVATNYSYREWIGGVRNSERDLRIPARVLALLTPVERVNQNEISFMVHPCLSHLGRPVRPYRGDVCISLHLNQSLDRVRQRRHRYPTTSTAEINHCRLLS